MKHQTINSKRTLLKKAILTIGLLLIFQMLTYIPAPFVDPELIKTISTNNMFDAISLFAGHSFSNMTFMAMGISSYITASIVMQLLQYVFKHLHDLSKAPGGVKIIKRLTILIGIGFSLISSFTLTLTLNNSYQILTNTSFWALTLIAIVHAIGTGIAIWIGETITEKGFGNGVSLLIALNILSGFTGMIAGIQANKHGWVPITVFVVSAIVVIFVETSYKNVKLIYLKAHARGTNSFSEITEKSIMPLKINMGGVMPLILSTSLIQFCIMGLKLLKLSDFLGDIANWMATPLGNGILTAILIVLFSFIYSSISFEPEEISKNIQKSQAVIENVQPGVPTVRYLTKTSKQLTIISSIYMIILVLAPSIISYFSGIEIGVIGATSIMIVLSVAIEIIMKVRNDINLMKLRF